MTKVPSKFSNDDNGESDVLRAQSELPETIEDKDGNEVQIRASELFNLSRGENGELGWPTCPNGKLAGFLRKLGVEHPSEVVGKEVVVRIRRKQGTDGTVRDFLGFVTD